MSAGAQTAWHDQKNVKKLEPFMDFQVVGARRTRWPFLLVGLLLAVFGLPFIAGGVYLITLGGSWYFALAGAGLLVSAAWMIRGRPAGAWLFAVVAIATVAWALADVGTDFWPLFSRLFAF